MVRAVRFVALMGALFALAGTHPKDGAQQPAKAADQKVATSSQNAALQQPHETSQHDKPCRHGNDNRASDLCAQWKAADAAESAANAAWWIGVAGSLIAAFTLAAAWAAARWAKKAAIHTEESAVEAKRAADTAETALEKTTEASQTDLRAWLTIDLQLVGCRRHKENAQVDVTIALKNIGKTPALRVAYSLSLSVRSSSVANYGEPPQVEKHPSQLNPMMPGQEVEQRVGKTVSKKEIDAGIADSRKHGFGPEPMIVVDGVVLYHTVFDAEDDPKRMTSVQYLMLSTIQPELRKERMGWLDERGPVMGEVTLVKYKSPKLHLT